MHPHRSARLFTSLLGIAGLVATLAIGAAPQAQAASFGPIVCTASVQYPHGSTHVSGTINVVSSVNCSTVMNEIYQQTRLYKSGGGSWLGLPFDRFNVSYGSSNAATACSNGPGTFYGTAYTILYPPAGYFPSRGTMESAGASNWVKCGSGVTRLAPSADDIRQLKAEGFTVTEDSRGVTVSKEFRFSKN